MATPAGELPPLPDRYLLYQEAVQDPHGEVGFLHQTYESTHGRPPRTLREDFCGSAALSCAWVRATRGGRAVGVDIDPEPLAWAGRNQVPKLPRLLRRRVELVQGDVCTQETARVDLVAGLNFSWCALETRDRLLAWMRNARRHLQPQGMLVLDALGGPRCHAPGFDAAVEHDGFSYQWETVDFDPITHHTRCAMHFELDDGRKMHSAFTYEWRLWTVPEVRDALADAGFSRTTVWWEGIDPETGDGDGSFVPATSSEHYDCFVCYVVAVP